MVFSSRERRGIGRRLRNFVWPEIGFRRSAQYLLHRLSRISSSPHVIAMGFAAGAFASFTPLVGFHFVTAALVALIMRGNLVASAVGTVVGNPLTFPFIWVACYNVGALMLGMDLRSSVDISVHHASGHGFISHPIETVGMIWRTVEPIILPMMIGGIPLGLIAGIICYFPIRALVSRFQERRRDALARGNLRAPVRS
jgi:hypothetical protein